MQLTHRIQLKPTPAQADYFVRACSTARFVWNWALAEWNRQYAAGQKPRAMAIKKQFNAIKYQRYPWLRGIHRDAHSQPFEHIDRAWKRFVGEVRSGSKPHAPRFKHKGRCRDSFYVANDRFKVSGQIVRLPLIGEVTMTEVLRFTGKILGATVSRTAQRWFIAIQVEVPDAQYRRPRTADGVVGVDLGVKCAVTLSTGEMVHSPMPLKAALRRVRIRSRRLSRKVETARAQQKLIHGPHLPCRKRLPLTGNRRKSSEALARLHGRIARTRADFTHKLTTRLCRENQTVVIEDLNVKGMLANERLARAIADVGFGALRSQLEYKARRYGTQIILADRWLTPDLVETDVQNRAIQSGFLPAPLARLPSGVAR
ncbi:transposase [Paraburkholderia sp. SIMBA_049]